MAAGEKEKAGDPGLKKSPDVLGTPGLLFSIRNKFSGWDDDYQRRQPRCQP
jgi:hypothetical protein